MNSLYIDRKGLEIKHQKDALLVFENGERRATIPLRLLERLILASQVHLSASVLGKLGSLGIGVMVLNGHQRDVTLLMPAQTDAHRRQLQYQACQNHALNHSKTLLHEKLQAQQATLDGLGLTSDVYWLHAHHSIERAETLSQLLGIEGSAAKHYFNLWSEAIDEPWTFTGRHKNPPTDPVNALLSLAYTLLYSETVRALYAQGLDVACGFYHQANRRRHALACDIMEPLRPQIDAWVVQQLKQQTWQTHHFGQHQQACLLNKDARQLFYQAFEQASPQWNRALNAYIRLWCQRWHIHPSERPEQWSQWEAVCSRQPTD